MSTAILPDTFATLPEAAGYLRVSGRTIRRAVQAGRLRARRVGIKMLFTREDLDAFVAGPATGAEAQTDPSTDRPGAARG
jgi:excisionase family DNA binding protein